MTQTQFKKYVEALWMKHGSPDKHGYVDLMRDDGFEAALREALERFGVDVKAAK